MSIYFATGNKNKVEEASEILGIPLKIAELELDEIQDMDLEKVAIKKAQHAFDLLQKPVFVDDVGVFISAWNGFPGPFAKFLQDAVGNSYILKMLANEENRGVVVRAVIAYHDGKKVHTFVGEVRGTIPTEPRGGNGWGFDPIIIPDGQSLTYSEMAKGEKNKISHRAKALEKFREFLNSNRA